MDKKELHMSQREAASFYDATLMNPTARIEWRYDAPRGGFLVVKPGERILVVVDLP